LSLRTPTLKLAVLVDDDFAVARFLQGIQKAVDQYGGYLLDNVDETAWHDVQADGKTIAPLA
jgi:hypothetical protein